MAKQLLARHRESCHKTEEMKHHTNYPDTDKYISTWEMNEVASINKFQTSNTTVTDKANKSSTMYKAGNLLPKISTMDIGPSSLSSWPIMWEGRFILSTFGRSRAGSTLPAYWCPYSQLSQSLTGDH